MFVPLVAAYTLRSSTSGQGLIGLLVQWYAVLNSVNVLPRPSLGFVESFFARRVWLSKLGTFECLVFIVLISGDQCPKTC